MDCMLVQELRTRGLPWGRLPKMFCMEPEEALLMGRIYAAEKKPSFKGYGSPESLRISFFCPKGLLSSGFCTFQLIAARPLNERELSYYV